MLGWVARICGLTLVVVCWARTGSRRVHNYSWLNQVTIGLLVIALVSLTPPEDWTSLPWHGFESRTAYYSCSSQVNAVTPESWYPNNGTARARAMCDQKPAFAAMAYCYHVEYPSHIPALLDTCFQDYNIDITREEFNAAVQWYAEEFDVENLELDGLMVNSGLGPDLIQPLQTTNQHHEILHTGSDTFVTGEKPFYLTPKLMNTYKEAYRQFLGNYDLLARLGAWAISYWFLCMIILAIMIRLPRSSHIGVGSLALLIRQKIIIPAAYKNRKAQAAGPNPYMQFLVPARIEVVRIVGFMALIACAQVYDIRAVPHDPIFHNPHRALLRYYAVRASILALSLAPLVFLTAGRNNALQWFTRWDYATFIALHRWLSRVLLALLVIHSVAYAFYWPSWRSGIPEGWLLMGILGTISGISIAVQSVLYLRRHYYEVFLVIHVALSIVFLASGYFHSKKFDCALYYYICFLIWYGDRLWRLVRMIAFGFPTAECQVFPDETIKVTVPRPPSWEPVPGGHAFVHFLTPKWARQSHPFTFTFTDHKLEFFIKAKKGLTRELHDFIDQSGSLAKLRVAIEGPYGEPTPAKLYDRAVFVAGGSGIPGIYAEVLALAKNGNESLMLVWVVRDCRALEWFGDELIILARHGVEIVLYVTLPPSQHAQPTFPSYLIEEMVSSSIEVVYRRPQIDVMISENVRKSLGLTCFVACGHPAMVDEIRSHVALNARNVYGKRVDYFEQLQVWA